MRRREALRIMAAAGLGPLPGCGVFSSPLPPVADATYTIPAAAIDHLRLMARSGYACWQGGTRLASLGSNRDFEVLSITKSVAALAAARAIGEGWLGADEVVNFPEWGHGGGRGGITVRHLVNSTAGIKVGTKELYTWHPTDKGAAAVSLPVQHGPGRVFRYGPAPWELLAELLRRRLAARGTTLKRWFNSHLSAIGIRPGGWRLDGIGTPYFSTGMECGFDDLRRLGGCLCHLLRGEPHAGLDATVWQHLTVPRAANPMFSAGMWWNRAARFAGASAVEPEDLIEKELPPSFWRGACLHPAADASWVALVGSSGSRLYVLPRASAVIAVARAGKRWSDAAMLSALSAR